MIEERSGRRGGERVPTIEARALTRRYRGGHGAFELGFHVDEGEIFGFLGPNGAGKTTTIRLLMCLLRPTSGEARVFGLDTWRQFPAVKARIAFVPGDLHLYERMTGEGLVRFLPAIGTGARWTAGGRSRGTSTSTSSSACATSPRATGRSWSLSRR